MYRLVAISFLGLVTTITGSSPVPEPKQPKEPLTAPVTDITKEGEEKLDKALTALLTVSKQNLEAAQNLTAGHKATHDKLDSMDSKLNKLSSIDDSLADIKHLLEHGHTHSSAKDIDIDSPPENNGDEDRAAQLKLSMLRMGNSTFTIKDLDKMDLEELELLNRIGSILEKAPSIGEQSSTVISSSSSSNSTHTPSARVAKNNIPALSSPKYNVMGSWAKAYNKTALKNHLYNEHGHTDLNGLSIGQLWYIQAKDHDTGFNHNNGTLSPESNWFTKGTSSRDINPSPPVGPTPPPYYEDCPNGVCPSGSGYIFNGPLARSWRRARGR